MLHIGAKPSDITDVKRLKFPLNLKGRILVQQMGYDRFKKKIVSVYQPVLIRAFSHFLEHNRVSLLDLIFVLPIPIPAGMFGSKVKALVLKRFLLDIQGYFCRW